MIEITVRFKANNATEMQKEVESFLNALRKCCGANDEIVDTEECMSDKNGYEYDDGSTINDALYEWCIERGVEDWRDIKLLPNNKYAPAHTHILADSYLCASHQ